VEAKSKKGKKTVEVVYLITSDSGADPVTLAAWVRGRWEIENKLHWVRDVTYQEDKSLVRTGNAPRMMASLRSLAISLLRLDGHANIAAANRHHAGDPNARSRCFRTHNDFAGSLIGVITRLAMNPAMPKAAEGSSGSVPVRKE
jgi:Transposase DDE domain